MGPRIAYAPPTTEAVPDDGDGSKESEALSDSTELKCLAHRNMMLDADGDGNSGKSSSPSRVGRDRTGLASLAELSEPSAYETSSASRTSSGFLSALSDSVNPGNWPSRLRRRVRPFLPRTDTQMEVERVKARLKSLGYHERLGLFIISPVSKFRRNWDRLMVMRMRARGSMLRTRAVVGRLHRNQSDLINILVFLCSCT